MDKFDEDMDCRKMSHVPYDDMQKIMAEAESIVDSQYRPEIKVHPEPGEEPGQVPIPKGGSPEELRSLVSKALTAAMLDGQIGMHRNETFLAIVETDRNGRLGRKKHYRVTMTEYVSTANISDFDKECQECGRG